MNVIELITPHNLAKGWSHTVLLQCYGRALKQQQIKTCFKGFLNFSNDIFKFLNSLWSQFIMNFLNPGSMRGPKSCDTVAITFISNLLL